MIVIDVVVVDEDVDVVVVDTVVLVVSIMSQISLPSASWQHVPLICTCDGAQVMLMLKLSSSSWNSPTLLSIDLKNPNILFNIPLSSSADAVVRRMMETSNTINLVEVICECIGVCI